MPQSARSVNEFRKSPRTGFSYVTRRTAGVHATCDDEALLQRRGGETGRRTGLKILRPERAVWVRSPPPALLRQTLASLAATECRHFTPYGALAPYARPSSNTASSSRSAKPRMSAACWRSAAGISAVPQFPMRIQTTLGGAPRSTLIRWKSPSFVTRTHPCSRAASHTCSSPAPPNPISRRTAQATGIADVRCSRSAACARHALMSSATSCGNCASNASSVTPPARYPRTSPTVIRVLRTHGLPNRTAGSTLMRSRRFTQN